MKKHMLIVYNFLKWYLKNMDIKNGNRMLDWIKYLFYKRNMINILKNINKAVKYYNKNQYFPYFISQIY
jgi:hypothetical protein